MVPQHLILSLYLLSLHYFFFFQACNAGKSHCTTSAACGLIRNISFPFRLKHDPRSCGRIEIECVNKVASVHLNAHQKYYVKDINYTTQTLRVADPSVNNDDTCSFPNSSAFYQDNDKPYPYFSTDPLPINFMRCPNPLKNPSLFTNVTHCAPNYPSHNTYAYAMVGGIKASQVENMCTLEVVAMTSWRFKDLSNVSLLEIHVALLYGYEVMFCGGGCTEHSIWEWLSNLFFGSVSFIVIIVVILGMGVSCPLISTSMVGLALLFLIAVQLFSLNMQTGNLSIAEISGLIIVIVPKIILCPLALWFLIHKFWRRHLSAYEAIECFLRSDNKLAPIKYSYSEVKKMTRNFQDKLGQGGYGSVYKGKLRSGHEVAVKLLKESGGNGQDIINEIATIGRIHHVNVVNLVGYCAQGSKRALVFDVMPNGSLEKYLFNRDNKSTLSWDRKFQIAIGVARGIEYLHRGCDIQILHFDMKPHNVLLDDKFVPKVSDFGLAKFCSIEKNTMTMTAARGTIGYVAPELINRGIGRVSYKADVYSFGMLLMEMVGLNRDNIGKDGDSSKYFPCWIYDQFNQGMDIAMGNADANDDSDDVQKLGRKMTIVALWCIQMNPDDRPSMNKVLDMLEADVERLQIPKYPSESTHMPVNGEDSWGTCSTEATSLLHQNNVSMPSVEITIEE